MNESWQNLIDLVVKPSATFERLRYNPKWLLAFVIFCLFSVVLGWTHAPYSQKVLYQQASYQDGSSNSISLVSLIITALVIAVLWDIILSPILAVAAKTTKINKELKLKHIYAGAVHTSLIRVLIFLANIGLLPIIRSVESVEKAIDIRVLPGLHHLAGSNINPNLLIFLSYINILSIWFIFIITVAIATMADVKRTTAFSLAICIWIMRVIAETLFVITFFPN